LESPPLPPRSRLYSLRPIATGTPEVESLTGYIARLAKAHAVSAGTLIGKEIVGRLAWSAGQPKEVPRKKQPPTYLRSINGITPLAASWVEALESLTHRSDLRRLTMLAWANVVPCAGLLRAHRAWCADCLREQASPYERLLWTIGVVETCPQHRRPLSSHCPHCSQSMPVLGWHTWPGQCSECQGSLADDSVRSASDQGATFHQVWTANAVGAMLAASYAEPLPGGRFMEALRFWTANATVEATSRLLEENQDALRAWRAGRRLPKLGSLLDLCQRLETSPVPFLTLALPASPSKTTAPACAQAKRFRKSTSRHKLNLVKLKVELEKILRVGGVRPPSAKEVSRRLGHAKTTLYRHFPKLCRAISVAHMDWRVERGVRRQQGIIDEVRKVAVSLHEAGREPTLREVAAQMTKPGSLRDPVARATLAQIRLQLGRAGL
jgi:hypothetical protein